MKDFRTWLRNKETLHNKNSRPFVHERDIWYCAFGLNVGFEQDGKGADFLRPVLVLKKFNNEIFWAVPLTSALKDSKFYYVIEFENKKSSLILSQLRLIDSKRLSHQIGILSKEQFVEATKKLKALLP